MHRYLRSIGFSSITREELENITRETAEWPDSCETAIDSDGGEITEIRLELMDHIGIRFIGAYDDEEHFHLDHYEPYCESEEASIFGELEMVRSSDIESYRGVSWDLRLGVELVYAVSNVIDFLNSPQRGSRYVTSRGICISALAAAGKILFPIRRDEPEFIAVREKENEHDRLLRDAISGDEEAFVKLTEQEVRQINAVPRRIAREDVLTITRSYIIPAGIEMDKYDVLGDVMKFEKAVNPLTTEEVYVLDLDCNGFAIRTCINARNLMGVPEVGRRFRGSVWMQAKVDV